MADWRKRAEIYSDVVYFPYATAGAEQRAQEVFVWDLDKTYLDTKFENISGLVRTVMEKAFQKRNVPGTAALVRALKAAAGKRQEGLNFPIYFITASPPQLEEKILEKLKIDGIQPFGLFCKDNLQNLRPRRLWRLTQQVGYKLQGLLQMRVHLSQDVRVILWGDDSESDAVIYCLYSDICTRRLDENEIRRVLKALHVVGPQTDAILELQSRIPMQDPVEKIYINLAVDTDAEYYLKFGRRVLPTYNTFQTALDLFQDQRLETDHVVSVAVDMINNFGYTTEQLERSFDDLIRRMILAEHSVNEILPILQKHNLMAADYAPSVAPKAMRSEQGERLTVEGSFEPWIPDHIDYLHDYR